MKRTLMLLGGVAVGIAVLLGGIALLARAVGDHEARYQGQPLEHWLGALASPDPAASNRAAAVINATVVPQLTNQMFADTNDSRLRLLLVEQLNNLPGLRVDFLIADGRRAGAVGDLGSLGPAGRAALPALLEALRRKDDLLCPPAAGAVGKLGADPATVIPLLIGCLVRDDGSGRPDVVAALAEYGATAKPAVPTLVTLLADRSSKEIMRAVPEALKKIDPEAAAKAGVK
jgi:HEAT repeat protein